MAAAAEAKEAGGVGRGDGGGARGFALPRRTTRAEGRLPLLPLFLAGIGSESCVFEKEKRYREGDSEEGGSFQKPPPASLSTSCIFFVGEEGFFFSVE